MCLVSLNTTLPNNEVQYLDSSSHIWQYVQMFLPLKAKALLLECVWKLRQILSECATMV
jgi:hypothetical protein